MEAQLSKCRKGRGVYRRNFTKIVKEVEKSFAAIPVNLQEIQVSFELLHERFEQMERKDSEILDLMLEEATEEELENEHDDCDSYKRRFKELRFRYEQICAKGKLSDPNEEQSEAGSCQVARRKFKLPVIEFKRYDGSIKDWLSFWAQFKKIHDDAEIDDHDKIEYLIQATVPDSRARQLVESFPAMGENYEKIIDCMESRFGREDLQIEVYVRELLKLVLGNAASQHTDLCLLYDKLETQLRALETLGITSERCSAILFPLIESCVPQDLLRVWQRASVCDNVKSMTDLTSNTLEIRLGSLMRFLKAEVENEQHISLAVEGFGFRSTSQEASRIKKNQIMKSVPTATGLVNHDAKCIFCDSGHSSENCFKARNWGHEDKRKILIEKRGCFRCLKVGHGAKKCRSGQKCMFCKKGHALLMCPDVALTKTPKIEKISLNCDSPPKEQTLSNHTEAHTFLQTLCVVLEGQKGKRKVRVLIDSGSTRSYVLKETAVTLGLPFIRREKLVHCLFGGQETTNSHNCYAVKIKQGGNVCTFDALDQSLICHNLLPIFYGPWTEELSRLGVELTDTNEMTPIEILLGADVLGKLYTGRRHVLNCGLTAMETLLGWTVMGKVPVTVKQASKNNLALMTINLLVKETDVSALWQLDVLGITEPSEKKSKQVMAAAAKELFLKTVTKNQEGRYEVRLPWCEGHARLPDNYQLAKVRLETTVNKLKRNNIFREYDLVFQEWLNEGIIEDVSEMQGCFARHFLPHRPVIKEGSTTKIRPVFDASAKEKNAPSLNQCLEKGPNLIEVIPDILLRFRKNKVGVIADIRKAFLQISLNERDRDFLRFLWIDEWGQEIQYRHRRVVFGVNSSPFLLGATIEYHLSLCIENCKERKTNYSREILEQLKRSFYVDNCVTSLPDTASLELFIQQSRSVMMEAQFDLRGWEYSRPAELDSEETIVPVLGLNWDVYKDTLSIKTEFFWDESDVSIVTKRKILSMTQRIFDPIGFTAPTTLIPKLLLQQLWESKLAWDQPIGDESSKDFYKWYRQLPSLNCVEIPRWVNLRDAFVEYSTLHVFCDASKKAYACAIFLRVQVDGQVRIHLLSAKSRVSPIKETTIPRLELLAATIGARLYNSLKENLPISIKAFFWSDSTTVLSWIRRVEEWSVFVGNRVREIRALTDVDSWSYIPGHLNPADFPSRGCFPDQLLRSKWWEGPTWMCKSPEEWTWEKLIYDEEEIGRERRKMLVTALLNDGKGKSEDWHLYYFSKYLKVVRMMAWIFRFIHNTRHPCDKRGEGLTTEEVKKAEDFVISLIQKESFIGVADARISSLHPYLDGNGLIRLKTRISRRQDNHDFLFPVVLPDKHPLVNRLIYDFHTKHSHVGTQGLLSLLRERYWILGGRRTVRSVISKCVICRRYEGKTMESDLPALPLDRVKDAAVFEVTGLDYAGPLYLRDRTKAWVCIFTCAVYRAVHLELVSSLSTDYFLQALRRFVARRGRPKIIYSDNGTAFVGAENLFKKINWKKITDYGAVERIIWKFNPPSAAWWGGFWERLIGVLKRLLRKVLGRSSLSYENLQTLLCDCENIINSRPISYLSNDPDDLVALTPNMFLKEIHYDGIPECDAIDRSSLCRRLVYKQKLRDDFKARFRSEYLGQLSQKWTKKPLRQIQEQEIVLIGNDIDKRISWPLGKVIEVMPGPDGLVRLVRLQTSKGTVLRPIQRLVPLECEWTEKFELPSPVCEPVHRREGQCEDISESSGVPVTLSFPIQKVTRSGRLSKTPKRFV